MKQQSAPVAAPLMSWNTCHPSSVELRFVLTAGQCVHNIFVSHGLLPVIHGYKEYVISLEFIQQLQSPGQTIQTKHNAWLIGFFLFSFSCSVLQTWQGCWKRAVTLIPDSIGTRE